MQTENPSSDRHFVSAPLLTVIVMAGWHPGQPEFPDRPSSCTPSQCPCEGRQAGVVVPI